MNLVLFSSLSSHRSIHCRLTPTSGLNPRIKSATLDSSSTTIIDDPASPSASEEESPAKIGTRVRVKVSLMSLFIFRCNLMLDVSNKDNRKASNKTVVLILGKLHSKLNLVSLLLVTQARELFDSNRRMRLRPTQENCCDSEEFYNFLSIEVV
ncbi:unnamed protein product [Lactuca saligna]|uniref:Uncharacterized protein n=1 Tax=Lactuca saligna TaxID=75948 RepID=A0AA35Z1P6_LACSI|nr:unnamed protein product [Lactuca saligna]